MFDRFDHIRIISLAHRKDRRREIAAELKRVGVEIDGERVAFFDAFKVSEENGFYSAGAHGCYLSHMELLETARGSILILEDDCDFTDKAADYVVPECDLFYGGYYADKPNDLHNSDIVGAHMMGYFDPNHVGAYFRRVLEDDAFRQGVPPPTPDGALVWYRHAFPDVRTTFATSTLANQRLSRTDVAQPHWIDRFPIAATLARKLKRMLVA